MYGLSEQLLDKYRRLKDKFLPMGTKRWMIYHWFLDKIKVLLGIPPQWDFGGIMLSRYRRLKDKIFPLGSWRRIIYDLPLNIIKLLLNNLHGLSAKVKRLIFLLSKKDKKFNFSSIKQLSFPIVDNPMVSIIIPVYNQANHTYNCLKSILENSTEESYEIIVVDDASTNKDIKRLFNEKIQNVKLIKNRKNSGFILSCHQAVDIANGDYLLFLNNDTIVTQGWLKALLNTFNQNEKIGAVGAKLIYPDGRLQEAGAIIWSDGSAWNFGRGDDPEKPEYNYVREVDYCSGACLMIKKGLFEKAGRFDKNLIPAYGDDFDLSMTLRTMGYKTIYQPTAVVMHLEGTSMGTDTTKGLKKYQVINLQYLRKKWGEQLQQSRFPNGEKVFLARERCNAKRILVIDNNLPTYDQDAGSVMKYEYLKIFLKMGFKIVFWPYNLYRYEPYASELQQMGIEIIYGSRDFKEYIKENGMYFDVAYLTRPEVSIQFIDLIKQYSKAKIFYDLVDLHFLREERKAKLENNPVYFKMAQETKQKELYLASNSDAVLTLSPVEKDILERECPQAKVVIVSYIQQVNENNHGFNQRQDLFFLGGFQHPPNADGVIWFVNEIYPLIRQKIPDIKFSIAGSKMTPDILKLHSPKDGIEVLGYVKDVTPYFENARIFISPLRYGAGIKGKNIQSMSFGLPIITTSIGAEGLNLTKGKNVFIADTPEDFANTTITLYNNMNLWYKLSTNSVKYVKENNSPEVVENKLRNLFHALGCLDLANQTSAVSKVQK